MRYMFEGNVCQLLVTIRRCHALTTDASTPLVSLVSLRLVVPFSVPADSTNPTICQVRLKRQRCRFESRAPLHENGRYNAVCERGMQHDITHPHPEQSVTLISNGMLIVPDAFLSPSSSAAHQILDFESHYLPPPSTSLGNPACAEK